VERFKDNCRTRKCLLLRWRVARKL